MGEIAEMMLDGTLCQHCGSALLGAGAGYPRTCKPCRQEASRANAAANPRFKVACPTCKKQVKRAGLADHMRDAHRVGATV